MQQGDVMVDVVVDRGHPEADAAPRAQADAPDGQHAAARPRRPGECITVLTLAWNREDPMAVHLTLRSTPDHPSLPRGSWIVLRDLLRSGLDEATGDGDVRIQPDAAHQRIQLRLARPGKPAWVLAPRGVLSRFLEQTDAMDPNGEEQAALAVDAAIHRLLRD